MSVVPTMTRTRVRVILIVAAVLLAAFLAWDLTGVDSWGVDPASMEWEVSVGPVTVSPMP